MLVNSIFYHRQVIDDILDIEADTKENLAGMPTYMIITQGQIAEKIHSSLLKLKDFENKGLIDNANNENVEILSILSNSHLLDSNFWAWKECKFVLGLSVKNFDSINPTEITISQLECCIKYALTNTKSDLILPLDTILNRAIDFKQKLQEFWINKQYDKVIKVIFESNVVFRIFDTIFDYRHIEEIESSLNELEDIHCKRALRLFYNHSRRSYQQAVLQIERKLRR